YAEKLIALGGAHYCFCKKKEMDEKDPCTSLSASEIAQRLSQGEPYVIRQTIPETGTVDFDDEVYGHTEVECNTLDEQILIKSDGFPTYNFA
ncbi:MAG: glutamate--tRNA ligase family protein, partial [bacterium]